MRPKRDAEPATVTETPLLDELIEAPASVESSRRPGPSVAAPAALLVGECLDARHPTLQGRALIRWGDPDGTTRKRWLPTLHGLALRAGDRVMITRPSNWPEAVVTGVIDGFAARPETPRAQAATLELHRDESVRVASADGTALLEVFQGESGPVVRLLTKDVELDLPGGLKISAQKIELAAKQGAVRIEATDHVVIQGEMIKLN